MQTSFQIAREFLQLLNGNSCTNVIHTEVVAKAGYIILCSMTTGTLVTHSAHTMRANQTCFLFHLLVVSDKHTTFTSRDILVREETECCTITNGAKFLTFVFRQWAMASILNHFEVVLLGNGHNLVHLGRETCHVNNNNTLCLGSNLALNVSRIDIDMVRTNYICKHRGCTHITDTVTRSSKGK